MEVEYILTYEDEFIDVVPLKVLNDISFEMHNVVVESIVPFANELKNDIAFVVVGVEDFHVQRFGPHIIPAGGQVVAVHSFGVNVVVVFFPFKRGVWIRRRVVIGKPSVERL